MMSRTYRKRNKRVPSGQYNYNNFCRWRKGDSGRDKGSIDKWKKFCFKATHRTRRSVEREEIRKIFFVDDYDLVWFNDSRAERKRKTVWWGIY